MAKNNPLDIRSGLINGPVVYIVASNYANSSWADKSSYICTGTADQNIIQNAIDSISGGTVILSPGTFNLTGGFFVRNNNDMIGASDTIFQIACASDGPHYINLSGAGKRIADFKIVATANVAVSNSSLIRVYNNCCVIENITIETTGSAVTADKPIGIKVEYYDRCVVNRCNISYCSTGVLGDTFNTQNKLLNSNISSCNFGVTKIGYVQNNKISATNCCLGCNFIHNNTLTTTNYGNCVVTGYANGGTTYCPERPIISNNVIYGWGGMNGTGGGIYVQQDTSLISLTRINDNSMYADAQIKVVSGHGTVIQNNNFRDFNTTSKIIVESGVSSVQIIHNVNITSGHVTDNGTSTVKAYC